MHIGIQMEMNPGVKTIYFIQIKQINSEHTILFLVEKN